MGEFVGAAFAYPAALFSFALIVVVAYWVLVLLAGLDADLPDDLLAGIGLRGVPASIVISLMVAIAWFVSIAGAALAAGVVARTGVLMLALGAGWLCARLLVSPFRRLFADAAGPSRADFVGRMCVIRTGRVGRDFGQAEVTSDDGSSALIQVRQTGEGDLRAGSSALIFDYDAEGEFFWVMPYNL